MFKKLFIAGLAIALGLAVVRGTWVGSHLRARAGKVMAGMRDRVAPEQEIARLRMELKNLARDDDQHYDKVARMIVRVDRLSTEVDGIRTNLRKEEARLSKLNRELTGEKTFVKYNGSRYTRDDLRNEATAFKTSEAALKAKEANLEAQRKHLVLERTKLTSLRTLRDEMATQLQQLETALAEERHAAAAADSTIDDAGYRRLRAEMSQVRDRIEVLKRKRELRGEIRTPDTDAKAQERDAKADAYLADRFGKEVAEGSDEQ